MEIIIGKHNGFCSGVKKAVDKTKEVGRLGVYTLGEIIHNKSVIDEIAKTGVKIIDDPNDLPDGATVIIRSHGVAKSVYEKLCEKNANIVDCTCPFVKKIHSIVEKYSQVGYTIVIVGESNHPEVIGTAGWCCGNVFVFNEYDESFDFEKYEKICIVAQTTCSVSKFENFLNIFKKNYCKTVEVFKTICYTTEERQREAEVLSKMCDAMVVIGGVKSSNTRKLYDVCKENCSNVFLISNACELDVNKMVNYLKVGIVSGASTPAEQSMEVFSKMEEVTEVKALNEAEVKPLNEMEEAVAKLEGAQQKFRRGQRVVATISSATDEGLALYINNTKKEILLSKEELDCEKYDKADYASKVGEEIEVMIIGVNPVILSQKAIKALAEEEKEIEEIKNGKIFNVTVDGTNKGGLTAKFGSYGIFIPSSQIRIGFVKDLEKYVGKTLRVKAEKVESQERRKQIVASQRVILETEKAEKEALKAAKEEAFFTNVHVGDVVTGTVVRFASFGAFVEVDGFDCLAHISDLSWTGAKSPADVLEIGKKYEFKVLKADPETKKVSIGYKQLQPRPWDNVPGKYNVGDVITGKVVRIVDFGMFVEIESGVDGLVHMSQISNTWLEKPTEGFKVGDVVNAKIIGIDYDKEKITLSIKATLPAPEKAEAPARPKKERQPKKESDGEAHEWKDSSFGGASIAELTGKN